MRKAIKQREIPVWTHTFELSAPYKSCNYKVKMPTDSMHVWGERVLLQFVKEKMNYFHSSFYWEKDIYRVEFFDKVFESKIL